MNRTTSIEENLASALDIARRVRDAAQGFPDHEPHGYDLACELVDSIETSIRLLNHPDNTFEAQDPTGCWFRVPISRRKEWNDWCDAVTLAREVEVIVDYSRFNTCRLKAGMGSDYLVER